MFTPEDVIAAYRAKGLRPTTGSFGLQCGPDRTWAAYEDARVCPIGALLVGTPYEEFHTATDLVERIHPDLHAWAFIKGVDGCEEISRTRDHRPTSQASFELGRAVRAKLLEEFPELRSELA